MATRRQIQVAEEIQQIVSVLLQRELKDPRIGFVTITSVDVTPDLKYARIYVSVMGTPEEQKATMDALASSRGFVRREIASRMTIRYMPEIQFKWDKGLEYSDRINRLLNELKEEESRKTVESIEAESGPETQHDADSSPQEDPR